ncbi:MAG: hypothetical protein EOP84_24630, partial [Verrucomicrobiaceae bacterium]
MVRPHPASVAEISEPKGSRTTAAKHASIASFHLVESFLLSLVDAKDDGRILISLEDNNTITLRYMLLNPAERFKEVIDSARSVILAGGTMEPMSDFLRQLFPAIPREGITTLSCRHVIPKENLLTQVVTMGPRKVEFEFIFNTTQIYQDGKSTAYAAHSLIEVMFRRLYQLSLDSRPEIRHCAVSTLFSALAGNAAQMSGPLWSRCFDAIVAPLFAKCAARSQLALKINEQAVAPELKRGMKMAVHHSRDTAAKQWSETRVLILKGLLRVLRAAAAAEVLVRQQTSQSIWVCIAQVCEVAAAQDVVQEGEVFGAAEELLLAALRIVHDLAHAQQLQPEASTAAITLLWTQLKQMGYACQVSPVLCLALAQKLVEVFQALKKQGGGGVSGRDLRFLLQGLLPLCLPLPMAREKLGLSERAWSDTSSQLCALLVSLISDMRASLPQHRDSLVYFLAQLSFSTGPDCSTSASSSLTSLLLETLRSAEDTAERTHLAFLVAES